MMFRQDNELLTMLLNVMKVQFGVDASSGDRFSPFSSSFVISRVSKGGHTLTRGPTPIAWDRELLISRRALSKGRSWSRDGVRRSRLERRSPRDCATQVQFVNRLDVEVVRIGREAPRLGRIIAEAEAAITAMSSDLTERRAPQFLSLLREAETRELFGIYGAAKSQVILEFHWRASRFMFRIVAFVLLLCCITGGHIAHCHVRNVLWYLHLLEHRYPSESSEYLRFAIIDSSTRGDRRYFLTLLIMSALVFAILYVGKVGIRAAVRARRTPPPTPLTKASGNATVARPRSPSAFETSNPVASHRRGRATAAVARRSREAPGPRRARHAPRDQPDLDAMDEC